MREGAAYPGLRIGRLVVVERIGTAPHRSVLWRCQCDCGNMKDVSARYLRPNDLYKSIKSCGCLKYGKRTEPVVRPKRGTPAVPPAARPKCEPVERPPLPSRHYNPADRRASK